jgi:hypothetical protein
MVAEMAHRVNVSDILGRIANRKAQRWVIGRPSLR